MKHLIPSQINEEKKIIKSFSAKDLTILAVGLLLICLVLASSLNTTWKLSVASTIGALFVAFVMRWDMIKGYKMLLYSFLYLARKKHFHNVNVEEVFGLKFGKTIKTIRGYTAVIELYGVDFGIFDERTQDDHINAFSAAVREVRNGKIIKLEKPLDLSAYMDENDALAESYAYISDDEAENLLNIRKRGILDNETRCMSDVHYLSRVNTEVFYFAICDENEEACLLTAETVIAQCKPLGLLPRLLEGRQLKFFCKQFVSPSMDNYDEHDENQGTDDDLLYYSSLKEGVMSLSLNGEKMRTICLGRYPYYAGNAWGSDFFALEGVRVVFNFAQYYGKNITKTISASMMELRRQFKYDKLRDDERMKVETNYSSLEALLEQLNYANEVIYLTECYLQYPVALHKEVMKMVRSKGITINDLAFTQYDGWLCMLPFLRRRITNNRERVSPIQSTSIAGMFPFVSKQLMDPHGAFMGYTSRFPAFFDQFEKTDTRVNHNMVVLGKSGGGKSYFLKKTVFRFALEGKRVFILDPDNEYEHLCSAMNGNWIDVAGETGGRINPLQVFPSLREGQPGTIGAGDVSAHRLFLQQFFRTVCPDMSGELLMYLDKIIADMYALREIRDDTELTKLQPQDFPTFDHLLALVGLRVKNEKQRYDAAEIDVFKKLALYIEQFAKGGVFSRLWNGITTLEIHNDLNVLNFQSLFANSNRIVANGQMLLLMRFLNQEVIRNREINRTAETEKKIAVVIDEAHRFINPQFPVALEFMSTMGKQIRKYSGALIVATQNIDDFIGVSDEMRAQASAVINACQYSMLFGLLADDINKVRELYSNYNGGLTQAEVDFITKARRGEALFIIDINTRLPIHIELFAGEEQWIEAGRTEKGSTDVS